MPESTIAAEPPTMPVTKTKKTAVRQHGRSSMEIRRALDGEDVPRSLRLHMQSAPEDQTFIRTCTKQTANLFSGMQLNLPASEGTHVPPEELTPKEGTRPAHTHTPVLKLMGFTETTQSLWPHHPTPLGTAGELRSCFPKQRKAPSARPGRSLPMPMPANRQNHCMLRSVQL